jgi:hypothetical protein
MILRELFYIDPDSKAVSNNMDYAQAHDSTTMKRSDTRKTRLTLKQLNQLRKSSETHILEQEKDLEFVEKMYKHQEQPM